MAWWQIREARQQAASSFEDSLAHEYREIARRLPVAAMLGEPLSEDELQRNLENFFQYLHLSSSQVNLRQRGRIRTDTWDTWRGGIESNLQLPAFCTAWEQIKQRSPSIFDGLRRLEAEAFGSDPREWNH